MSFLEEMNGIKLEHKPRNGAFYMESDL